MQLSLMGLLLVAQGILGSTAATAAAPSSAGAANGAGWNFVTRDGSHLELNGAQYRYSGPNVEWLGMVGYGPLNFAPGQEERYPTKYEIDDALATAHEMGARVVRAQTLGDTVGCPDCMEPTLGNFNEQAFRVMDYVLVAARRYGIRVIPEFLGDARAEHVTSTADIFSKWRGGANFYSDPTVVGDFKNHISRLLNRVNSITGVAYKDDPTILGWMNCNVCSLTGSTDSWDTGIADYVKSIDHHHLFIDNSALLTPSLPALLAPNIDVFANEVYPHWGGQLSGDAGSGSANPVHVMAGVAQSAGKAWVMSEFGWDRTDWTTPAAFENFLSGVENDASIAGDSFWSLESHTDGHGWKPLPADQKCQAGADDTEPVTGPGSPDGSGCQSNEDGNWWALYYTGVPTLSNTAQDMSRRAQLMRGHAFTMAGTDVPRHDIPPRPTITSTSGGKLYWQGSAGAVSYTVQSEQNGTWVTVAHGLDDSSDGWRIAGGAKHLRVVPVNADGVYGPASPAVDAAA